VIYCIYRHVVLDACHNSLQMPQLYLHFIRIQLNYERSLVFRTEMHRTAAPLLHMICCIGVKHKHMRTSPTNALRDHVDVDSTEVMTRTRCTCRSLNVFVSESRVVSPRPNATMSSSVKCPGYQNSREDAPIATQFNRLRRQIAQD